MTVFCGNVLGRYHKKPIKKGQNNPKCKQPMKGRKYVCPEIRCGKKSRGGISYEVILAEPSADKPYPLTSVSPKSMTAEEITQKLQQAEERRKEASRKREETNAAYIYATQAALVDKLNATSINREAYQNGLRAKITDRLNNDGNKRKQLDAKINDLRQTIEDKLRCAEENRTESIRKICEKLKEHHRRAELVRANKQRLMAEGKNDTASSV
ncbi:hypothetical protein Pmani_014241 [Petrolisthes manimaculis]|uniref:Stathmin n=1 Tax=Petrolisthes manimaculis TaxID=1843537 RepID=A0AAE1PTI3_9EUCA|nr:hypothetical protein Pmani_014241 [Petrolisthes manimaculis]